MPTKVLCVSSGINGILVFFTKSDGIPLIAAPRFCESKNSCYNSNIQKDSIHFQIFKRWTTHNYDFFNLCKKKSQSELNARIGRKSYLFSKVQIWHFGIALWKLLHHHISHHRRQKIIVVARCGLGDERVDKCLGITGFAHSGPLQRYAKKSIHDTAVLSSCTPTWSQLSIRRYKPFYFPFNLGEVISYTAW